MQEFWDDLTFAEIALYSKRASALRAGYWAGYFSRVPKLEPLATILGENPQVEDVHMSPEQQAEFYERTKRAERDKAQNG